MQHDSSSQIRATYASVLAVLMALPEECWNDLNEEDEEALAAAAAAEAAAAADAGVDVAASDMKRLMEANLRSMIGCWCALIESASVHRSRLGGGIWVVEADSESAVSMATFQSFTTP